MGLRTATRLTNRDGVGPRREWWVRTHRPSILAGLILFRLETLPSPGPFLWSGLNADGPVEPTIAAPRC